MNDSKPRPSKQWPAPCDRHRMVKSINTVATTNFRDGKLDRALAFYEEALLLARTDYLLQAEEEDDDFRDEEAVARLVQSSILLASTLNSIAVIRWCRGLLQQSKVAINEAMEAIETSGPKISALVLPTSPSSPRLREAKGKSTLARSQSLNQLFTELKWVKCTTMFNQGILCFLECDYWSAMAVFEATLHAQRILLGPKKADTSCVAKTQEYLALCRKKIVTA